jgi:hypothetical protein
MREMGKAMMGTGEAEGDDRAIRAAEAAISNPLLEDTNMKGARGLLINITGGSDVTLFEVDQAANRIGEEVDKDANIMFGMSLDENMAGRIRVSVVATGIDSAPQAMPNFKVVNGGEPVRFPDAVSNQAVNQHQAPSRPAGYVPEPPAMPLVSKAYVDRGHEIALGAVEAAPAPAVQHTAPAAVHPLRRALRHRNTMYRRRQSVRRSRRRAAASSNPYLASVITLSQRHRRNSHITARSRPYKPTRMTTGSLRARLCARPKLTKSASKFPPSSAAGRKTRPGHFTTGWVLRSGARRWFCCTRLRRSRLGRGRGNVRRSVRSRSGEGRLGCGDNVARRWCR